MNIAGIVYAPGAHVGTLWLWIILGVVAGVPLLIIAVAACARLFSAAYNALEHLSMPPRGHNDVHDR